MSHAERKLVATLATAMSIAACASDPEPSAAKDETEPTPACFGTSEPAASTSSDCAPAGVCPTECGGGHAYTCSTPKSKPRLQGCYVHTTETGSLACCATRECVRRDSEDARCGSERAFACAPDQLAPAGCRTPQDSSGVPTWTRVVCCP